MVEHEGLKAVDLFRAVRDGRIRAVWIMGTNPAVSLPESNAVRQALQDCELVIVSDCVRKTDTSDYADVLLPAQTWGERNGTVTNSERRISRQRAVLPIPGEARGDWWIITEVAKRMGFVSGFPYHSPVDIFREHAGLSGYRNDGQRDFDISAYSEIDQQAYDELQPIQWPVTKDRPGGTTRMFEDGRFYTDNGRARLVAVEPLQPAIRTTDEFPLLLNTGRVRDQWHTMTRTGKSARLSSHIMEPFASIHPDDAARSDIIDGGLVRLVSPYGEVVVRAEVSDAQKAGEVFCPMHWNGQFASKAVVNSLVKAELDPFSGQPQFKQSAVRIEPYQACWYGFLLSRRHLKMQNATYWSHSRGNGYWRYEIAGEQMPDNWAACARDLLCASDEDVGWIEYFDKAASRYRAARLVNKRLESCIFIGPDVVLPSREYLAGLFANGVLDNAERASLLRGKPATAQADTGPTVCACFNVGLNSITAAIEQQHLTSVEEIGVALKAGTNCGSCIPELHRILEKLS
jgi:assimilatory nitrate reductase catalytic subunit